MHEYGKLDRNVTTVVRYIHRTQLYEYIHYRVEYCNGMYVDIFNRDG